MRAIDTIVVHGSWTKPGLDIGADTIRKWHTDPKPGGRGWSDIGYHYVIRRDGRQEQGRPVDKPGAHVAGHNAHSIGICLVGGREDDTPKTVGLPEEAKQELLWEFNYTRAQMASLAMLVDSLVDLYGNRIKVMGHRDFPGVVKRCPGFDVRAYFP